LVSRNCLIKENTTLAFDCGNKKPGMTPGLDRPLPVSIALLLSRFILERLATLLYVLPRTLDGVAAGQRSDEAGQKQGRHQRRNYLSDHGDSPLGSCPSIRSVSH
jgi:hypothetical protein